MYSVWLRVWVRKRRDRLRCMSNAAVEFLMSEERFTAFVAGRGTAKTTTALFKSVAYINENPGCAGICTVPQLDDAEKVVLRRMRQFFGETEGKEWVWREKKSGVYFPGLGSVMYIRPGLEVETFRGADYAFAWMDEAGKGKQLDAWLNLRSTLRQRRGDGEFYPRLPMWITTTPTADQPWIKQVYFEKVDPLTRRGLSRPGDYKAYTMRSIDSPWIPEDEKERMRELLASGNRWARQEYGGEYVEQSGLGFPDLSEDVHLRRPGGDVEFVRYVAGIDFGGVSPTAIVLWGQDRSKRLWALKEFYVAGADDYQWLAWCEKNGVSQLICDPATSEERCRFYRQTYGVHVKRAWARSFPERYRLWAGKLAGHGGEPGLYISPECVNLWREMTNLTYRTDFHGGWVTDKWALHSSDHAYDAASYGMSEFEVGVTRPRPPFKLGEVALR
jgi:phage terminase large subunit-like protein